MPIERSIVPAAGLVQPSTPYSQILRVRCGELAFISGQVAVDEKGVTVGDDIDSQMEQVFKNLRTALEAVGAGFEHIVRFGSTVKSGQVEGYSAKRKEMFPSLYPDGDFPTNSIIIVQELPSPEWLVEIEALVALP